MGFGTWGDWRSAAGAVRQSELSWVTGSSRKVLLEWEREGMPRGSDGTYDLAACIGWIKNRYEARALEASDKHSPALERLRVAKAVAEEIRTAQLQKQIVAVQTVQAEWGRALGELRTALLGLPNATAPKLAHKGPAEVARGLEAAIRVAVERAQARIVGPVEPEAVEGRKKRVRAKVKARKGRK